VLPARVPATQAADRRTRVLLTAFGLAAALSAVPHSSRAQSISGVLVSAVDSAPVPFGTVTVVESGQGRFTDAEGQFFLGGLAPGIYHIRARQIGFSPVDTTVTVADAPVRIVLRLRRLAVKLAAVRVTAGRADECVATGIPDSAANPRLAGVFSQLADNVDRYRILVDEYPFRYRREERRVIRVEGRGEATLSFDTAAYDSRERRQYRIGDVLYDQVGPDGVRHQYMYIPTFRDLADTAFQAAHCFSFAGQDHGTIRIDFQPATRIDAPDVEGSLYLDADRYIIRRAVFRLTKPGAVDPPIRGLAATTTFAEIVPLVPVVGSTHSDEVLEPIRAAGVDPSMAAEAALLSRHIIEDDRLLDHTFLNDSLASPLLRHCGRNPNPICR
jgi:hypothetical protein